MESKYLLHVTQADRWPAVLSNLGNLRQLGLAQNVIVLMNGTAIYTVQGRNDWTEAMGAAAEDGVHFEICERSLANHGFPLDTIPRWATTIWAAIPVIAEHVANGFVYIKP